MTTLTTPFLECHKRAGAKLVEFAGFLLPISYEGILAEHRTVRTGAGVFDVSHMGEFEVRGPDAGKFVDHLVTNRVANVEVGQAVYTPMCLPDGGIVDDLLAYKFEDRIMLVVNAANIEGDWAWVQERAQGFDVRLENVSERIAQLAVQGPRAAEIFEGSRAERRAGPRLLPLHGATLWGVPMVFSRTGLHGRGRLRALLRRRRGRARLGRAVQGGREGRPEADRPRRARHAAARDGVLPLRERHRPHDATRSKPGLGWTVKLDKDDFCGKAALEQAKAEGSSAAWSASRSRRPASRATGWEVAQDGAGRRRGDERHVVAVARPEHRAGLPARRPARRTAAPRPCAPGTTELPARVVPRPFYTEASHR
jgi:aminomethyltransferase